MSQSFCWARLPRAGLGNKLLVWGRAVIFARLSDLPLWVTGFNKIRIGPILRGERSRYYFRQFSHGSGDLCRRWLRALLFLPRVIEPAVAPRAKSKGELYVFQQSPHWSDYFAGIREHRHVIQTELPRWISQSIRSAVEDSAPPVISVHVRCGDFRELRANENFARVGLVRTPLQYFDDAIQLIRSVAGRDLPVTIFSDGAKEDIAQLLRLPNVQKSPTRAALADLLVMSRSRIIIPSAGSTFSYWAAFLSEAAVMLHPQHIHSPMRPSEVNQLFYEGPTPSNQSDCPVLLRENIQAAAE